MCLVLNIHILIHTLFCNFVICTLFLPRRGFKSNLLLLLLNIIIIIIINITYSFAIIVNSDAFYLSDESCLLVNRVVAKSATL